MHLALKSQFTQNLGSGADDDRRIAGMVEAMAMAAIRHLSETCLTKIGIIETAASDICCSFETNRQTFYPAPWPLSLLHLEFVPALNGLVPLTV